MLVAVMLFGGVAALFLAFSGWRLKRPIATRVQPYSFLINIVRYLAGWSVLVALYAFAEILSEGFEVAHTEEFERTIGLLVIFGLVSAPMMAWATHVRDEKARERRQIREGRDRP
jgi:hypothetical protein